jgi:cobalt-zinc-cadmium efflux system membrane fusion protein
MKPNLILILLILSVNLFSCKNKPTEVAKPDLGLIEITKAQFQSEKMEFGVPSVSPFSDLVHFTGTVIPSVNGRAQVSLPARGIISHIYCKPGQSIGKGALLFEVSGNEFIDMQKDFAESAALLIRLKSEFERQKELFDENIGTKKDFILAESTYNVEKAKCNALKIKIEILGLDVSKIEEGAFYTSYSVKSPIKGFVVNVAATIGQYVESQQTIAEIIDVESFQLMLSVFERDINKVKVGQNAEFYLAGNKGKVYTAKLNSVGKTINNTTKSIDCFAELENFENNQMVSNQFVEGEIIVASDSVLSLPESAILKSGNETFVLALEKETNELYYFRKLKLTTGRKNNGFVELTEIPESKKILLRGVYNILIE